MAKLVRAVLIMSVGAGVWLAGCTAKPAKEINKPEIRKETKTPGGAANMFTLKSPAFANGQVMPVKYANRGVSGGENVSPPLSWENPPPGTKSFAIAVIDRHPIARNWIHWLVIDIPPQITSLPEGASSTSEMPVGSKELLNTAGSQGYGGPQPPPGSGVHDYEFTIYALKTEKLGLPERVSLDLFLSTVEKNALGSARLVGKFSR